MSHRTNNLYLFELDSMNDYIEMWEELDKDYSKEGADEGHIIGVTSEILAKLGYKSQAERIIKELFAEEWNDDDLSRVEHVLDMIKLGHGDYSSQFQTIVAESEEHVFSVAVSYLT